jgi:hypothetical protein
MIHCAVPLSGVHKTAQGFGFLQPALLTDYGDRLKIGNHHLNVANSRFAVYHRIAGESEIFRLSSSWYTPAGYALENLAGIECLKNGHTFNKTDSKNNLIQITLRLRKGDQITCWMNFIRAHNKTEGFDASVVVGAWPTHVVYIPEDVTNPDSMSMGHEEEGAANTQLIDASWFGRGTCKDLVMSNPLWILLYIGLALVIMFFVYGSQHLKE